MHEIYVDNSSKSLYAAYFHNQYNSVLRSALGDLHTCLYRCELPERQLR